MADFSKGVGKSAPQLAFIGDKWNNKGTYKKDSNPDGYYFGQQPNLIRKYIMNELDGRQGNLIKLMWYLLSTDEGFGLAQATVLAETGLAKQKYYQARDALIERGWLLHEEKEGQYYLAINYNFLWAQTLEKYDQR